MQNLLFHLSLQALSGDQSGHGGLASSAWENSRRLLGECRGELGFQGREGRKHPGRSDCVREARRGGGGGAERVGGQPGRGTTRAVGKLCCAGHTDKAILERALILEDVFLISCSDLAKEMVSQGEQRPSSALPESSVLWGRLPIRLPPLSGLALSQETTTHVCFPRSYRSVDRGLYGVNKGHRFSTLLEITLQSHKNAQFHQRYITVAKNIPRPLVSSEQ